MNEISFENEIKKDKERKALRDRSTKLILVVDDEIKIRSLICEQLEEVGYQVEMAENGDEALRVMADLVRVDLLITDIRMPGSLDGFDLIERAVKIMPNLLTIAISGFTGERTERVSIADCFLAKPFTMRALEREVIDLLAT